MLLLNEGGENAETRAKSLDQVRPRLTKRRETVHAEKDDDTQDENKHIFSPLFVLGPCTVYCIRRRRGHESSKASVTP